MLFVVDLLGLVVGMRTHTVDLAGRIEQHRQMIDSFSIIFTLSADIADPCGEILHGDQFTIQPRKICHTGFMHLPNIAFTAGDHTVRFAVCSQNYALTAVILPFLSKLCQLF